MARRRQEDTDIDQYLMPQLEAVGIPRTNIKRNVTTGNTGLQRGDLWISSVRHDDPNFERKILALVECKDRKANIDDRDWLDAKKQGVQKSKKQGMNAFFVTNTDGLTRCYSTYSGQEVSVDGELVSQMPSLAVIRAIQTQVDENTNEVSYRSFSGGAPNPKRFRSSLWNLRQIFRSSGMSKGGEDSIIKTTLTFCILKLVAEKQTVSRTIPETVLLWNDWRDGQLNRDMSNTITDLTALDDFKHLGSCLQIDERLDATACSAIKRELDQYKLFNSDFDFFGIIYESFANKELKKDFGEFYTPRHVIQFMVATLLKNEVNPREIQICDPACGTGGFLVEAFLYLREKYEREGSLDEASLKHLKNAVFCGFDTNDTVAIPYARTNMMMAGDGGTRIQSTEDSLLEKLDDEFDYVLANVPYGLYAGDADVANFAFTNARRFELLFLEKVVNFLKPGGRAAIVVPDSVVEATSYASVRYNFLLSSTLEAVVSLPAYTFEPYTSEKTYILYFRKKRPSEAGKLQSEAIWHYVVDFDGFKKGKKRYPINDDDFPSAQAAFCNEEEVGKCGFVPMTEVNPDNFYNLCSEFHIRRPMSQELLKDDLIATLDKIESFL